MSDSAESIQHSDLNIGPVFEPTSAEAIYDVWQGQFGTYPETTHELDTINRALDEHVNSTWAWTASTSRSTAGILVGRFLQVEDIDMRFDTDTSDWPKPVESAEISMVAVTRHFRNQGIATELCERFMKYASQYVDRVFAASWQREDAVDSSRLFESLGFERLGEEPEYYDTEEYQRDCPDCGLGCSCSAAFYTRTLGDYDA